MTSPHRVELESPERHLNDLHIEFDGQTVTVRTDVANMHDYVAETYQPMLVEQSNNSIGHFELTGVEGAYFLRGASKVDHPGEIAGLYEYLKHELLVQFIRERQDLLWLHAAAVERNGMGLLVAGPSGQGKSTLSTHLCEKGWKFMSDDIAPVRMSSNDVLPFPLVPFRRVGGSGVVERRALEALEKERVFIPTESIRRGSAPIAAIVFPVYRPGAAPALLRMPPGNAAFELLRSYTNFVDHKESGVSRASELARSVPAWEITYGDGADAASLLNSTF
jgi:hypothetical protein